MMEARRIHMSLFTIHVMVLLLMDGASAQSSSCNNVIVSLSPCLNYITGNVSTPSTICCLQLGIVVQSEPQCLCSIVNGVSPIMGLNINKTQASALPGACRIQTLPLNLCNALNGPTSSPPSANAPAGSSDGSIVVQSPVFLLFALLFAMAYISLTPTSF